MSTLIDNPERNQPGLGRISPVWLTFSNPDLEKSFKDSWRNAARPTARIWAIFAVLFYALMTVALYRLDPGYVLESQWFRLYVCVPLLLAEFFLACWPGGNHPRFEAMYLITSLACFGNAAISHGVSPEHLKFFFLLELALIFVFCASYFRATYIRITVFVVVSMAVATPIILFVHIGDRMDTGRLVVEMVIIAAMVGTVLLTAYHREILLRRNYRDIRAAHLRELEAREFADLALADSRARSQFLSNVGLEFQVTLDNVSSQSTPSECGDAKLDGYMSDVHYSALRLQKMVHQIMDVAAGGEDRQAPNFIAFSFKGAVEDAIDRARYLFEGRPSPLIDCTLAQSASVFADAQDVRDILDELISNAAKHGPVEEVIECSLLPLSPDICQLRIHNAGPGLSENQLKGVFDPFVQLDDGLERHSEGLGLGLPHTRRLAEMNGGRLYLESPATGGVTAILELPVG